VQGEVLQEMRAHGCSEVGVQGNETIAQAQTWVEVLVVVVALDGVRILGQIHEVGH
jgi:hypothetical protein